MDQQTAQQLTQLTNEFYAQVGGSFSKTRQNAWPGWDRLFRKNKMGRFWLEEELLRHSSTEMEQTSGQPPLRVLDLACGNLRFERYLAEQICDSSNPIEVWAVDNNKLMTSDFVAPNNMNVTFLECDLTSAAPELPSEYFNLAVCFGFMHHLPLKGQREKLIKLMLESSQKFHFSPISFWKFASDPNLRKKAEEMTAQACDELGISGLDEGDYLLGWQNEMGVYRYCHSFTDEEIDELLQNVANDNPHLEFREVDRYSADGRTGDLNRYVILQRL